MSLAEYEQRAVLAEKQIAELESKFSNLAKLVRFDESDPTCFSCVYMQVGGGAGNSTSALSDQQLAAAELPMLKELRKASGFLATACTE